MARFTAPSLWLPGFDPEPSEPLDVFIETETSSADSVSPCEESPAEMTKEPARLRGSWRVLTSDTAIADRKHWPPLTRADLHQLGGGVTKFEANLAAIQALRELEAGQRPPTPQERRALLRYTGWGGLPASFNLEATDAAWAQRSRHLNALLTPQEYESARASVNNSV